MKRFTIGAIGARTPAFKTVRYDELALQKYGITVEPLDLSELVFKVQNMAEDAKGVSAKIERLKGYTDVSGVPDQNLKTLAKMGAVIDKYRGRIFRLRGRGGDPQSAAKAD